QMDAGDGSELRFAARLLRLVAEEIVEAGVDVRGPDTHAPEARIVVGARAAVAAGHPVGRERIGWTGDCRTVARLGRIADARARAADGPRRLHQVRWAGAGTPVAGLGEIAVAGRGTTRGPHRLHAVGGTSRARAVAVLGDVAASDRAAADDARG